MADPATAPEQKTAPRRASPKMGDRARLVDLGLETLSLSMLAFIVTGLVVWSGRREISRELAEAWLRDHGVEAAVELDDLDATGFTGKVRLGARNNPVFSADRLEVAYDLSAPWMGGTFGIQTKAVRLIRPRVLASIDDKGQVRFGALQPLIDEALKSPKKPNVPGPAILVEDARLDLITPGGRARITGDASLDDGQLLRFDGRLAPLHYAVRNLVLDSKGATVSARKRGERLTIEVSLAIDSLESAATDLSEASARLSADLPYPDLAKLTASGPLEARLDLRANGGRAGDNQVEDLAGDIALTGRLDGGLERFAFLGRLRGNLQGARLSAPALDARDAVLTFDLDHLTAGRADGRISAQGDARATLRAGQAVAAGTAVRDLRAKTASSSLALTADDQGMTLKGPLEIDATAARLAGGALALSSARLNARGRIDQGPGGLALALNGSAGGTSGISGPDAERLAALIPNPAYARPLSQALRTFTLSLPAVSLDLNGGRTRLSLGKDARLSAPNGVVLTAGASLDAGPGGARGALKAALSGGGLPVVRVSAPNWRANDGVMTSPLSIATENFDLPPIEGVTGQVDGQARIVGGRFTLTTARCVAVTAKAYALGDAPVTAIKAQLCPAKAPLLTAGAEGWNAALRFQDAEGALDIAEAKLTNIKGEATLGGTGGFDRSTVRIDSAAVTDAAANRRFNSVLAKGGLTLSGGVWGGTFQASTPVGAPLGQIRLRHVVATGRGQADIDASKLAFAKGGLQPAELSPMAAFAQNAQGPASFTGVFAWDAQGATSRGRLIVDKIDFTSPIGFVATLDGAIDFTSLAPLTSAPDQTLKIVKIDSLVPLTAIESVFQLGADALHVSKATFEAAKGRISIEPTDVPFEPGKTISGVLVIEHLDLGEVLAASSLGDKVKAQAVVDGRLPFTFGPEGLRFLDGKIRAIRPGRIELSRAALTSVAASPADSPNDSPGAPPAAPAQVNAIQDFAYQAMENLAFDQLEAGVNSTDKGRLGILFHIKGEHDPKVAEKARVGLLDLLRGQAFNKRIALPAKTPVDLTLDTSLNFDELLAAWRRSFAEEEASATQPRSGPVQP